MNLRNPDEKVTAQDTNTYIELTAIILTYNEANNITACIESLNWVDRVLIFDSFSTDDTVALAQQCGADTVQSSFFDYAQQRNNALDNIFTDWVLFVDADERATPELGEEIRKTIAESSADGWFIPRHNFIFGQLTRGAGWYPDYQLRLFRHGRVRYERPVHEIAVVEGELGYLSQSLIHFNYRNSAHFHAKQRAYANTDAGILRQEGIKPKFYTFLTQPVRHFWWRFFTLGGYRDGVHGLRLSFYMAYYEGLKYKELARLWQSK